MARRPLRPGVLAGESLTWAGRRTGPSRARVAPPSGMGRPAATLTWRRVSVLSCRPRRPSSASSRPSCRWPRAFLAS
eukprot:12767073-Alexandrium_andersonii.AAC.1